MKKLLPLLSLLFLCLSGLTPLVRAQSETAQEPLASAANNFLDRFDLTFTLDNACDARTLRFNRLNPAATAGMRGDTAIINGKLFTGGIIPSGFDRAFDLDANTPNSLGTWRCIQTLLNDPAPGNTELPLTGAVMYYFDLQDGALMVQGLSSHRASGSVPRVHALIGGTGIYKGASGEVHEEVIGNNNTGAFNLRFTFRIKKQSLK